MTYKTFKQELFYTVGGDVEWCHQYGKLYGGTPKH